MLKVLGDCSMLERERMLVVSCGGYVGAMLFCLGVVCGVLCYVGYVGWGMLWYVVC